MSVILIRNRDKGLRMYNRRHDTRFYGPRIWSKKAVASDRRATNRRIILTGAASICSSNMSCRRGLIFGAITLYCYLLRFEPQLLGYRLPVKVYVLQADLIALNLSEASHRIGDGATGRWGAVKIRTGVGAV